MNIPYFIGSFKSENAVVTKIGTSGIYISPNQSCDKPPECHGCTACGTTPSTKHVLFCSVSEPTSYSKGECVPITYFGVNEALAAFLVFGLPIFCAITTSIVWNIYFSNSADSWGAGLAALSALIVGFLLVYIIEKTILYFYPVTINTENR